MASSRPKNHTIQSLGQTDLNVLSSQRSGLFGLSILWIMLFHSTLTLPGEPLRLVKTMGYAGVDVFLLLSGLGLYYSMERDSIPLRFYQKRALRVLLPYLLAALVYEGSRCLLGLQGLGASLRNLTFVSLFRDGDLSNWFVAFILLCYLAYPLIYRAVKSTRRWLWGAVLLLGSLGVSWLVLLWARPLFFRIYGLLLRVPVFLVGCFLAPLVKEGRALKTLPTLAVCTLGAGLSLVLWTVTEPWYLRLLPLLPLSLSLSLGAAVVRSWLPKENWVQRLLGFLGGITLEIYLIHERLLGFLGRAVFPNHQGSVELNGLAVLLAVALAWGLKKLCDGIRGKAKKGRSSYDGK